MFIVQQFLERITGTRVLVLFFIALLWRIALVLLFSSALTDLQPDRVILPYFGHIANDYIFLVRPAEHLYTDGEYVFRSGVPFAGRMPGYSVIYLFWRMMMSAENALLMLVISQAVLGALGVLALAKAARLYFNSSKAFAIAFILGMLYPASAFFDYKTIAEGLTISLLSFTMFFLVKAMKSQSKASLVASGLLMAWIVFLRPYMLMILPLFGLFILIRFQGSFKRRLIMSVIWALPFVVALGAWNVRNYMVFDKVILLQTNGPDSYGKMYGKAWLQIREMITAWGGQPAMYESGSEGEWFRSDRGVKPIVLPAKVYGSGCFTEEDLSQLKIDYQQFHYSEGFDSPLSESVYQRALQYTNCYREYLGFTGRTYLFVKRGIPVVARSGSAYMPAVYPSWIEKPFRLFLGAMYYFIMLGWLWSALRYRSLLMFLLPPLLLVPALLWVSTLVEHRYFLTLFPFAIFAFTGGLVKTSWFSRSADDERNGF
jgi:hypothetical protein